eukprot:6191391-Prorocentrum_lima.AAC.1
MHVNTCSCVIVFFVLLTAACSWQVAPVLALAWATDNSYAWLVQNTVFSGIGHDMILKRHSICTSPATSTSIVRCYAR